MFVDDVDSLCLPLSDSKGMVTDPVSTLDFRRKVGGNGRELSLLPTISNCR